MTELSLSDLGTLEISSSAFFKVFSMINFLETASLRFILLPVILICYNHKPQNWKQDIKVKLK